MVIGHQKQLNYLKRMIESGKIPHALLFSGQEKLGKKTIALEFLSQLFHENPLQHPDFILIEPQGKHPEAERSSLRGSPAPSSVLVRGQIQINQIRDLAFRLSLKPIKAQLKAAIIDEAHSMTKEAQNCFLKTLEEPKGNTLLILVTQLPNFLLPTIISRCEIIKFYPVRDEEIRNYLKEKGISEEKIEEILETSLGKPGRAIDLLKNPEKLKERKEREKKLIKILKSPLFSRFQYAQELSKTPDLKETLNEWLFYFRNIFISKSSEFNLERVKNILNVLQRIIFLLSTTNVNQRLALEILMMEF